jgi:hypothetical protein
MAKMKLLTQEIIRNIPRLYATEGAGVAPIIVKYFDPSGAATWYITEGEEQDGDWLMFGLCDLGLGFPELGYVNLDELRSVKGAFGLGIERDLYFDGYELDYQTMEVRKHRHSPAGSVHPHPSV